MATTGNYRKFKEKLLAPGYVLPDGTDLAGGSSPDLTDTAESSNAAAAVTDNTPVALQKMRITLDDLDLPVPDVGFEWATVQLADLGNRKLLVFGLVLDLDIVKSGGALISTQIDLALGTVAITSKSIQTAQFHNDIMEKIDINDSTLTPSVELDKFSVLSGTTVTDHPQLTNYSGIHLNIILNTLAADANLRFNGTIDIYYMDVNTPAEV